MSTHISDERSPYLRLHADNPVDWYPWGKEAFDKARAEDKPVFLSIGYSTCHYCHRMAEESFVDAAVAEVLNRAFVSVKVDREERRDVDSVYMLFCTALNGNGGWPLTVLMTAEGKPFFVGTYIPRDNSAGQAGLLSLLKTMEQKWYRQRDELERIADEITDYVRSSKLKSGDVPDETLPVRAAAQLAASYDSEYGGFGTGIKFPSPHNLIFLMRTALYNGDKNARAMAEATLRQMYRGGIYDHIGGGFARYSTDREWLAPHFEKTLYDNALLALTYTEAWQSGHMALYRSVAENTLDYCLRELKGESGGFYGGQDADSGGQEGAYYLFTPDEVKKLLGEDEGRHFCECYDITDEGNFRGKSIPDLLLNNRWGFLPEGYDDLREKLRLYRAGRMELAADTKLLTGWNGLMLMALSRAARAFGDRRYLAEARELAAFMERELCRDGVPMARLCEGELRFDGGLDDYVFYALGLTELYAVDYAPEHISRAGELAEAVLSHFKRPGGGFFLTSDQSEPLILRPAELYDGAMPSGMSAAAVLFDSLYALTGIAHWREERDSLLAFISANSDRYSAGCVFALTAMLGADETQTLVCVCRDETLPPVLATVTGRYAPRLTVLVKTPGNADALAAAAPFTASLALDEKKDTLYVFKNGECAASQTVS